MAAARRYSVVITKKNSPGGPVTYLDLTRQFVEKHVAEPCRNGLPLDMVKAQYARGDIASLRVYEHDMHSSDLRNVKIALGKQAVSDLEIAESGTEVTDRILGGKA